MDTPTKHIYNFQKVTPEPFSYLHCIGADCPNRVDSRGWERGYFNTNTAEAYADLNGEPYKAYYCPACKAKAESEAL